MPSPGKPIEEQYSSHPSTNYRNIKVIIIKVSNHPTQQTDLLSKPVGGYKLVWGLQQEVANRLSRQTVPARRRRQTATGSESGNLDECYSGNMSLRMTSVGCNSDYQQYKIIRFYTIYMLYYCGWLELHLIEHVHVCD